MEEVNMRLVLFIVMVFAWSFGIAVAWRVGVLLSIVEDVRFGVVFYNSLWAIGLMAGFIWFLGVLFGKRSSWGRTSW